MRRRPYSIVLLDEIEKAHPDTFNILLQVLDEGRLTDNKGRVANFKNAIVIMTSNMAAEKIMENFEDLEAVGEEHREDIIATTKQEVIDTLKENLRPEFLNRIDEVIMFLPLTKEEIRQILVLLLKKVEKLLARQGMEFAITGEALDLLADAGYDPQYGARPMKRALQDLLIDELAKYVIGGDFAKGDTVYVTVENGALAFVNKAPKGAQTVAAWLAENNGSTARPIAKAPAKSKKEKQLKKLEKAAKDVQEAADKLKEKEK